MNEYHRVWLDHHPGRTEQWLRERMADGFGIHHVDGDHENNAPENLVLIDWTDHRMIHAGKRPRIQHQPPITNSPRRKRTPRGSTLAFGKTAYAARLRGRTWASVARAHDVHRSTAITSARTYATHNGLPWPPQKPLPVHAPGNRSTLPKEMRPAKPRKRSTYIVPLLSPQAFTNG